jgi:GR25 family glycosyltransferase involved in LPS biosynthesis
MAQAHQIMSKISSNRNGNDERNCAKASVLESKMDIFYINLDRSENRRKYMESQLNYYKLNSNNRVRAVTIKDVIVPNEASVAKDCAIKVPNTAISYITSSTIFNPLPKQLANLNKTESPYKIIVTALCGRPRNSRKEMIVTISHLQAIKSAIYSKSLNPYALILEDDMNIAFDIDFMHLARSAPKDFGILQLVTSNDHDVKTLFNDFKRNSSNIWLLRKDQDFWCAGAYIINKSVLKPLIDKILYDLENGW